jgi:eukaryotic-like serine/threonine-protein kinase
MPIDLFRTIESKIAQREREIAERDIAVDLQPAAEPVRVVTQRIAASADDSDRTVPEFTIPADRVEGPPARHSVGIGRVLQDRYVIESLLGSGGMGSVYKALDRARREYAEIDCHVAIKILHEDTLGRSDVLSNLRREFYCAQALSHRSVVRVFELDNDQDLAFFTMELIDGELLSSVMRRFLPRPLPRSYVWAVIREVGAGLAHAHARHVIHADIKPQNIMVTNLGEVRILDFGASGESVRRPSGTDSAQQNPSTALTPAYACCELLEGREPEPRDDLYALACLSYELLAGKHPFQHRRSTEARTLKMTARRPPGLTRRQWKALTAGLAWDRKDRSSSIQDWLALLAPGSEPLGPVPRPEDCKSAAPNRYAASAWLGGLLVALLAALTIGIVLHRPTVGRQDADIVPETSASAPLAVERAAPAVGVLETARPENSPPAIVLAPRAIAADSSRSSNAVPAAHSSDKAGQIGIEASSYKIRAGENFLEIHVHRSSISNVNTSFVWWTEPSSAIAGVDYVPQARTSKSFLPGTGTASLFVKVIPNPSRKQAAVFYVVIGDLSSGSSLGRISRAEIVLPPK